jgi:CRISPR/Cas system CMR-associated protein Cmr3 (group 5 of RAMP superfamily)
MSKEQQGLLDEVYENYKTVHKHAIRTEGNRNKLAMESLEKQLIYTQEEFINKCKTDTEFSEKWGLKIEERELSLKERTDYKKKRDGIARTIAPYSHQILDNSNIPTKLITITYNDKTIESYE